MEEKRIHVYGKDAEGKRKRGFDFILVDGKPYVESVNTQGQRVKTPVEQAKAVLMKLQENGYDPPKRPAKREGA